ncbi:unnamed protein product [Prunus armeniaca]
MALFNTQADDATITTGHASLLSPYFSYKALATTQGSGYSEEREGRSKVEESTSEYSPVKIFAQTFGVFTEITNLVCAATPPYGSTTEGAPQLPGFAAKAIELLHGPVVEASTPLCSDAVVTLLPYHHTLGLANGSDALHHHIAAHSQLGTINNFGPILEQLHSFPHLPPPLMYAPSYASNKTLARVQLGSTHII